MYEGVKVVTGELIIPAAYNLGWRTWQRFYCSPTILFVPTISFSIIFALM